jgi:hypothetical protein
MYQNVYCKSIIYKGVIKKYHAFSLSALIHYPIFAPQILKVTRMVVTQKANNEQITFYNKTCKRGYRTT